MDKIETFEQFMATQGGQISFIGFLVNLSLAALLSYLLGLIYVRYGSSLSNRKLFANNFMVLTLTTMVIITIIKSSLALSLGLVGALSIIRFRSAIKEPEELSYIFLTIAIGLGFGADQGVITIAGFVFIAFILFVKNAKGQSRSNQNLHLTIAGKRDEDVTMEKIVEVLNLNASDIDMKRLDENKDTIEASFLVEFNDFEQFSKTKKALLGLSKNLTVSFMDNKGVI